MNSAHHLISLWNPSYTSTPMEAHLAVLQDHIRAWRDGGAVEEAVYVWWGKIRSENRQQAWARGAEMLGLQAELEADEDRELQLYLTDYRSLYVGDVGKVSVEDEAARDPAHVPAYYREQQRQCDCWFRLHDLRRLVSDDTIAVIGELGRLLNVHYHNRPVSLYGGMVDLPLLVSRPDGRHFFDEDGYARLAEDQLWVEFDAEAGGTGAMQRDLRENLVGDEAWMALDPLTRTFLATAEKVFRDHRGDDAFDFQAVLGPLGKAVEVEVTRRLRDALRGAPEPVCRLSAQEPGVDLRYGVLTLGQLPRALKGDRRRRDHLVSKLENAHWLVEEVPSLLDRFRADRNPGTHSARVSRDTARQWRDRLLGVGCQGFFVELARCQQRQSG